MAKSLSNIILIGEFKNTHIAFVGSTLHDDMKTVLRNRKSSHLVRDFLIKGDEGVREVLEPSQNTKYYEVNRWGQTYRFVDPKNLSKKSIETLEKRPDVMVFDGDLSGRLVEISKDKICIKPYLEL